MEKAMKESTDRTKLLTILIGITLVLSAMNLYATVGLQGKIDAISGSSVAQVKENAGSLQPAAGQQAGQPVKIQVSADDPVKGSKDAPVTIVEFSDFQCPYCGSFYTQTLPSIEKNYIETGKARLVFMNFPLGFHQYAQKAAEASECAQEQGKFWEYHDKLFENQAALDIASLKQYAKGLSLDQAKFDKCLDSGATAGKVSRDSSSGQSYGVTGTPSFFINGIALVGAQPFGNFQKIIEQELSK